MVISTAEVSHDQFERRIMRLEWAVTERYWTADDRARPMGDTPMPRPAGLDHRWTPPLR